MTRFFKFFSNKNFSEKNNLLQWVLYTVGKLRASLFTKIRFRKFWWPKVQNLFLKIFNFLTIFDATYTGYFSTEICHCKVIGEQLRSTWAYTEEILEKNSVETVESVWLDYRKMKESQRKSLFIFRNDWKNDRILCHTTRNVRKLSGNKFFKNILFGRQMALQKNLKFSFFSIFDHKNDHIFLN